MFSSIWHNKSNLHLTVGNSRTTTGPLTGDGTINQLLHSIGVWKEHGKDESRSLGLLRHNIQKPQKVLINPVLSIIILTYNGIFSC